MTIDADIARLLGRDPPKRGAMAEMLHRRRSNKDFSPHHVKPTDTLPIDKAAERSMTDIRNAASKSEAYDSDLDVDHYRYLRDVGVANDDLASRLRHRAMLMRQRADQFDRMADQYKQEHLASLESAVRSYDELSIQIIRLLEEHRHVEPTKV